MSQIYLVCVICCLLYYVRCINVQIGNQKYSLCSNKIKKDLLDFYNTLGVLKSDKNLKDNIKKVNLYTKFRKRLYKDRLSVYANVSIKEKGEEVVPVKVVEEKENKENEEKTNILDQEIFTNFMQFNKNNFFCIDELGLDVSIPLYKNSGFGANVVYQLPETVYVNAYTNIYNTIIKGEFNSIDILKRISFFQFFDNFYLNAHYDFKSEKALLNLESKLYEYYNKHGDNISFNNKIIVERNMHNEYDGSVCLSLKYNNNVFTPIFNFKDKTYEYVYDNISGNRKFSVKVDKDRNVHFNYLSFDRVDESNKYFLFFNFIFSNPMQSIITLKREFIF
ncbi:conserved Plasmodium protein, unknown function [Plasmodium sp. gorilla clade G2]|uniref:conserved Plasmodium protein, unknown function n=1 Tax=Plasmodium sp. gorilla clade G2 TaxID=880535 RepID=UPI000D218977|nr:conserved Plasmodium protein, unknown function [Plasmodium sp. gorilla clade G2]SOV18726.1 conserved Plasmodium protein, unknown function [Plasmodium sp. gorilla clade G2]